MGRFDLSTLGDLVGSEPAPAGLAPEVADIWRECQTLSRYVLGIMADIQAGIYTAETAAADFQYWEDDNGNGLAHSLDYFSGSRDDEDEDEDGGVL